MKDREDYLGMRYRDLKRHLLLLGATEYEIYQRLDKKELVDLAMEYQEQYINSGGGSGNGMSNSETNNGISSFFSFNFYQIENIFQWIFVIILFCLIFCILYYWNTISSYLSIFITNWFSSYFYHIQQKFPALKYSFKKSLYVSILFLLISIILDLYIAQIQISVILRWFISSNSIFLAKTISFPLRTSMLNSMSMGNYFNGLDVGPMITIWLCQKIKQFFENKSAEIILLKKQKID
jgi:hypothetical protein